MDALLNTIAGATLLGSGLSVLLLDVAIKGFLLLSVAAFVALTLKRASAASRHLVWSVAVIGLLLLPAVSLVAPKWTVPGLTSLSLAEGDFERTGELAPQADLAGPGEAALVKKIVAVPSVAEATGGRAEGTAPVIGDVATASIRSTAPESAERKASNSIPSVASAISSVPSAASQVPTTQRDEAKLAAVDIVRVVPAIWLVGTLAVLIWIVGGMLMAWMLVRSAHNVPNGPIRWLFEDLTYEIGFTGSPILLQARGTSMPMVWGLKPRVIIPVDVDDWTDDRLRSVLLHELAHVKRRDYVTQLLARFAAAIYWFNPLVWIAVHRMRVERELACDDEVLCTGSKASDYAGHLLEIASGSNGRLFAAVGGVAMARRSRLSSRLLAVLDDTRRRASVTPRMALAAWSGAAFLLLPLAGAVPGSTTVSNEPVAGVEVTPEVLDSTAPALVAEPSPLALPSAISTALSGARPTSTAPGVPSADLVTERMAPVPDLMIAEAVQTRCDWYDRHASVSHWMSGEDDDIQVRITMDDCRLELEVGGEIFFNDAETDIVDISRNGYFEMEEREGRSRRRIVIEPAGGGQLERSWYVDGDERPYDSEASDWLTDMIPLLFRRVGLQAEERAGRILDRDGVNGVMQEISLIPSDYIARKYYQVVLTDGQLDNTQLRSIVRQAGEELESDYELAQLLVEVAENHPVDESVMVVYVEAAGSLESDYEQRRVLDAILSRADLSADVAEAMLHLATDLESDYELAELLIAIMHRHPIDEALTTEFFEAVHTLDSDYEHNRVLKVALHEGAPNLTVLDLALESAGRIDSDYERAELLLEVARLYPVDRTIPGTYLDAAQSLESDYELGRVLKFLIDHQRLSEQALATVLDASLTLDSDYELANLLLMVVDRYDLSDSERDTYFEAVTSMDSDYELGRVLKAIVLQGPLTEQNLSDVLTSAAELDSEYEMANLLIVVANEHQIEGELRTMFMRTVDKISSDYERGRVLSALNPRGGRIN